MAVNINLPAFYFLTRQTPSDEGQAALRLWLWGRYAMGKIRSLTAAEEMILLQRDAEAFGGVYDWWFK